MMRRMHVFISGRVQGVFFRAYTRETAMTLKLTGWVRNLPDGNVETVFEGKDEDVEAMLEWCKKGPPHAIVNNVEAFDEPYRGEFHNFRITY
ncbi:MAG TPA: acylphosphatase [Syntrophaceae bacterium]|jgi:acylphosphatase|nr:acylphosphatase [Syntrophaceae bacterium]